MLTEAAAGLSVAGRHEEALGLLSAPGAPTPEVVPAAGAIAAVALTIIGRTREALAVLDRASAGAAKREEAPGWWATDALTLPRIIVLARSGDARALRRTANELRGQTGRAGRFGPAGSHALLAEGLADLLAGDAAAAIRPLRQSAEWARRSPGAGWTTVLARGRLVAALASIGDVEAARSELAALEADHAPSALAPGELAIARAWCAEAMQGTRSSAAAGEDRTAHLAALHLAWRRCHDRTEEEAIAAQLVPAAAAVDGPAAGVILDQVEGWSQQDVHRLERAIDGFTDLGRWLDAAEAAGDASSIHHEAGRLRAAAASSKAADRYLVRSGSATPIRRRPQIDLPTLTKREREIADLAAAGLSNRAIADRLVLSVRTVEGHLLRASAKVGVDSRSALAEVVATWPARDGG
jgi:DNA-binding CsgD family transcriptional regulator